MSHTAPYMIMNLFPFFTKSECAGSELNIKQGEALRLAQTPKELVNLQDPIPHWVTLRNSYVSHSKSTY